MGTWNVWLTCQKCDHQWLTVALEVQGKLVLNREDQRCPNPLCGCRELRIQSGFRHGAPIDPNPLCNCSSHRSLREMAAPLDFSTGRPAHWDESEDPREDLQAVYGGNYGR